MHVLKVVNNDINLLIENFYNNSFFLSDIRSCYRFNGEKANWGLDCRIPLLRDDYLLDITKELVQDIEDRGIEQVVGVGISGALLVGGILSLKRGFSGALIRDSRKKYGFREIIEGKLDKNKPIAFVDDIFSSGSTILRVKKVLDDEGLNLVFVTSIFRFGWRNAKNQISELELDWSSLATIDYKDKVRTKLIWKVKSTDKVKWIK